MAGLSQVEWNVAGVVDGHCKARSRHCFHIRNRKGLEQTSPINAGLWILSSCFPQTVPLNILEPTMGRSRTWFCLCQGTDDWQVIGGQTPGHQISAKGLVLVRHFMEQCNRACSWASDQRNLRKRTGAAGV